MTEKDSIMERKIKDILQSMIQEGHLPFKIIFGTEKEELLPYYDEIKDRRMDNTQIENRYVSALAVDNETGLLCGSMNFILFFGVSDKIQFWKRDPQNLFLNKVTLQDLAGKNCDRAITIGYTYVPTTKNAKIKYIMVSAAIKIVKEILKEQFFVFIESTGCFNISPRTMSEDILKISQVVPEELISNIGITRDESKAVEKFAKTLGLKEAPDYFNLRTLGKVFIL